MDHGEFATRIVKLSAVLWKRGRAGYEIADQLLAALHRVEPSAISH
jgi:hypothetical protein